MDTQSILTIVIIVILTLFFIGISYSLKKYLRIQEEKIRNERNIQEMEFEFKREGYYNTKKSRDKEENELRYIPRLMEEIPYIIEKSLIKSQKSDYRNIEQIIDIQLKGINDKLNNI